MNIRHYIKMIIHEVFSLNDPMNEEDAHFLKEKEPGVGDLTFGFIIIGILLFVLLFLILRQ